MNETQTQQSLHPVHNCNDGFFNSASGKKINLLKPTQDMICIEDIANALSKICRFGGQIGTFYSVAQHSAYVAALAPDYLKRHALLHDAAEAYLGDVIKPLKVQLGATYTGFEISFDEAIANHFKLDPLGFHDPLLKECDKWALELEHEALQKGNYGPLVAELRKHQIAMETDAFWAFGPVPAHFIFIGAYTKYFNL